MMSEPLEQRLTHEVQAAVKARERRRTEMLRMLLAAVKKARIDAFGKTFGPLEEIVVLEKARKQREEAIELYHQANRPDLVAREQEEIELIRNYLPPPLSEAEVQEIVTAAIAQLGAATIRDMGKVMALVQSQTRGKYDNSAVAALVKAALGS